jgi:hypothetical protein
MVLCPVCLKEWRDVTLYSQHVEEEHRKKYDYRTGFYTMRRNDFEGGYRLYERHFDIPEKSRMETLDQFMDLLREELPAVLGALKYPAVFNVKVNLTMSKLNSDLGPDSFYPIGLQGRNVEKASKEFNKGLIDRIVEDLLRLFDLRTNISSGLTLVQFDSVEISSFF